MKESEVSGLSGRLARESEALVKEVKTFATLEQRITAAGQEFAQEMAALREQRMAARQSYNEQKEQLVDAWRDAKRPRAAHEAMEELTKQSGPAPAGTRKGNRRKSKKKEG
jgi:chromosome condensin MukBEF ATPase and DNA-binding subunit MukB